MITFDLALHLQNINQGKFTSSFLLESILCKPIKAISMKKNTLILFFLFIIASTTAQEVVSTQGDSYSNTNGGIDFTIGEVIISTFTGSTYSIAQGFHQSNWNFLSMVDYQPNYAVTIFPNPIGDVLNIKTNTFEDVAYTLFDSQGKAILQGKLNAEQTAIHVSQLASGTYLLILNNTSQKLKTFKLVKTN